MKKTDFDVEESMLGEDYFTLSYNICIDTKKEADALRDEIVSRMNMRHCYRIHGTLNLAKAYEPVNKLNEIMSGFGMGEKLKVDAPHQVDLNSNRRLSEEEQEKLMITTEDFTPDRVEYLGLREVKNEKTEK